MSFNFGANLFYKVVFFFLLLLISLRGKLFYNFRVSIKILLKYKKNIFPIYFNDAADVFAFHEIFVKEEYDVDFGKEQKIIFDLGSNSGLSVIFFKLKYPNAIIFAFEPNPVVFKKLKKNTKNFSNIKCFNFAISYKDGFDKFYVCDRDNLSSSFIKRSSPGGYIEVETRSVPSIIKEFNINSIDLIKFDVEGAEFKIFSNNFPFDIVQSMVGEVHLDLVDQIDKEKFISFFNMFNKKNIINISEKRFILQVTK
jgi:FkbM family methyltransferase